MALVQPAMREIDALATPLNPGERCVLDRLVQVLDDSWRVYVQPHLLNRQPDFLICHPQRGVCILEVKDWHPDAYRARNGRLQVRNGQRWSSMSADPVRQTHDYRWHVLNRYFAPPHANVKLSSVRGSVVMPRWPAREAWDLLQQTTNLGPEDADWVGVFGREFFQSQKGFWDALHAGQGQHWNLASVDYDRFVVRLAEPDAIGDQRRRLPLSAGARNVAQNPSNATTRRIRGPAGSGKTMGLAARAVRLAEQGASVLVLTYTITLAHYVQDLVHREARVRGVDHRGIDVIHVQGFCGDLLRGRARLRTENDDVVAAARDLYDSDAAELPRYDAILVDEGQDFRQEWWMFLRDCVWTGRPGEMVLAADATQDLFGVPSWTDDQQMLSAGFNGPWTVLQGSYRYTDDLVRVLADFAQTHLTDADIPTRPVDVERPLAKTIRRWHNGGPLPAQVHVALEEMLADGASEGDVVVLTFDHQTGMSIADTLSEDRPIEHVWAPSEKQRNRAKRRFWPGVATVKGCTVQSFKGWESRGVVLVITDVQDAEVKTYVGMSRTRIASDGVSPSWLTVVNDCRRLASFAPRFTSE